MFISCSNVPACSRTLTLKMNHPMLQNDKIECSLNVQITIKIFLKHVNNVLNIKTFKLQTVASDQCESIIHNNASSSENVVLSESGKKSAQIKLSLRPNLHTIHPK